VAPKIITATVAEGGKILQDNMVAEATEADDGEAPVDLGLAKKKKKKKKVTRGNTYLTVNEVDLFEDLDASKSAFHDAALTFFPPLHD